MIVGHCLLVVRSYIYLYYVFIGVGGGVEPPNVLRFQTVQRVCAVPHQVAAYPFSGLSRHGLLVCSRVAVQFGKVAGVEPANGGTIDVLRYPFCAYHLAAVPCLSPWSAWQSQWNTRVFSSRILVVGLANLVVGAAGFEPANVQISGSSSTASDAFTPPVRCRAFNSFHTVCRLAVGIRRLSVSIPLIRYRSDIPPADKVSFDLQRILLPK